MRETDIYFPAATLGCPLAGAYSGEANARFTVTEVIDGPPRLRLATSDERRTFNVTFLWTWEQVQIFESFVAADLHMGLHWFRMDQLTGAGMAEHFCHLLGDYSIRSATGSATHYEVAFQVEAFLNAYPVPPAFVMDDPVDAGDVADGPPPDSIDAREAEDPRPPDRIDALVPGA